jgi:hypothetical protein
MSQNLARFGAFFFTLLKLIVMNWALQLHFIVNLTVKAHGFFSLAKELLKRNNRKTLNVTAQLPKCDVI